MVGTNIEIHNTACWAKVNTDSFYLDVGRITSNYHFSIVPVGILGLISPVKEGAI